MALCPMHATISDVIVYVCVSGFKTRVEGNALIRRADEIDFARTHVAISLRISPKNIIYSTKLKKKKKTQRVERFPKRIKMLIKKNIIK